MQRMERHHRQHFSIRHDASSQLYLLWNAVQRTLSSKYIWKKIIWQIHGRVTLEVIGERSCWIQSMNGNDSNGNVHADVGCFRSWEPMQTLIIYYSNIRRLIFYHIRGCFINRMGHTFPHIRKCVVYMLFLIGVISRQMKFITPCIVT